MPFYQQLRTHKALRRFIPVVLFMLVFQPLPAQAWGRYIHYAIADMAEQQLAPQAEAAMRELLAAEGAAHLVDITMWADDIKQTNRPGQPTHSVLLSLDSDTLDFKACQSRFCSVSGIEHYEAVLKDRKATPAQRLEALKYVVHLIGDVHQPLHTSSRTGAGMFVQYGGKRVSFHRLWDAGFIKNSLPRATIIARVKATAGTPPDDGGPQQWAREGRDIAREIFRDLPVRKGKQIILPADYQARNWPIAARRMAQAAARIAVTLNRLLPNS